MCWGVLGCAEMCWLRAPSINRPSQLVCDPSINIPFQSPRRRSERSIGSCQKPTTFTPRLAYPLANTNGNLAGLLHKWSL